jgi:hypothetical protein
VRGQQVHPGGGADDGRDRESKHTGSLAHRRPTLDPVRGASRLTEADVPVLSARPRIYCAMFDPCQGQTSRNLSVVPPTDPLIPGMSVFAPEDGDGRRPPRPPRPSLRMGRRRSAKAGLERPSAPLATGSRADRHPAYAAFQAPGEPGITICERRRAPSGRTVMITKSFRTY